MDPELKDKLSSFAQTVSGEDKALRTLINGNKLTLSLLNTIDKSNLVAAINEVLLTADNPVSFEDIEEAVNDYFVMHPQSFTYDQNTAVSTLLITHPLDHDPAVSATDSAGTRWVGQVTYPSNNLVRIDFNFPFSGKVVLT